MKIVIISDIHGNFDALSALPENYDELWVLGDLVNAAPHRVEVIDLVLAKASLVVGGNHDQCVGQGDDPQCSPRFRDMAEATRPFSGSLVTSELERGLRYFSARLTG